MLFQTCPALWNCRPPCAPPLLACHILPQEQIMFWKTGHSEAGEQSGWQIPLWSKSANIKIYVSQLAGNVILSHFHKLYKSQLPLHKHSNNCGNCSKSLEEKCSEICKYLSRVRGTEAMLNSYPLSSSPSHHHHHHQDTVIPIRSSSNIITSNIIIIIILIIPSIP